MTGVCRKTLLTFVWIFFFAAALVIVYLYAQRRSVTGTLLMLPEQVGDALHPVLRLYALYLGGILAFWFVRPFKASSDVAESARFWIALICTAIFNGLVLLVLSVPHLDRTSNIANSISTAMNVSKWASFLVAGANAYYFGSRQE